MTDKLNLLEIERAYKGLARVAEDAAILARGTPVSGPLQESADAAEREAKEARVVYENARAMAELQG